MSVPGGQGGAEVPGGAGLGGGEVPGGAGLGGGEVPGSAGLGGVEEPGSAGLGGVEEPGTAGLGGGEQPGTAGLGGGEVPGSAGLGGDPPPSPDPDRLAHILEAEGIATSDDEPAPTEWLGDVVDRGLADALAGGLPAIGGTAPWIAGAILLAGAGLAALLGVRLFRIVRAGRRADVTTAGAHVQALAAPEAPPSRAEVDRRLAAGDAAGALRALWRWVASHVEAHGFARPAPDRTNRELLAEVCRSAPGWDRLPALARLTDAIDGMLYAGGRLDTDTVRALMPLAEQVVR